MFLNPPCQIPSLNPTDPPSLEKFLFHILSIFPRVHKKKPFFFCRHHRPFIFKRLSLFFIAFFLFQKKCKEDSLTIPTTTHTDKTRSFFCSLYLKSLPIPLCFFSAPKRLLHALNPITTSHCTCLVFSKGFISPFLFSLRSWYRSQDVLFSFIVKVR
jgi:hypothetical protein